MNSRPSPFSDTHVVENLRRKMSEQPVVQYHDPSSTLASSIRDAIQPTKEAAEKHLKENRDTSVLPIRPTKVAQDMQSLLQEVR